MISKRKTRLNTYLDTQQREKLQKLSQKSGAPIAELVRRAVELYLKREDS